MQVLIGHQLVVRMLDRAASEDRLRHAYLLAGPARVGKTTVARWLALRLNCQGPTPPCGDCRACRLILSASHPDVRTIQLPAERDASFGLALDIPQRSTRSAERVIGIDQVRALQHDASLAPHEARWKVYVIVGAESLSLEAANCLLKTLEEPPVRVVLLLTVGETLDLPATVISRCQVVRMGPVPATAIATALVASHGCDADRADLLARLSGGRPGWAIEAATKPTLLEERNSALDDLELTMRRSFHDRLGLAERLATDYSRDQGKVLRTLMLWQLFWWDVQLIQRGCGDLVTNVDRREVLGTLADRVSTAAVQAYLQNLANAAQRLLQNVNPRLALEALLLTSPTA
jgi:DNA polymerase-3 subunit delta'